jgi:ParD-like antitoxin of type II bacterial toxin-antitoxin system
MGQPVKLSDALVMEARIAGEAMQRSIAGQVEFWASLGKEMERIMTGGQISKFVQRASSEELMQRLNEVDQPEGRARLDEYLKTTKFPRYWPHPEQSRTFIREEADGTQTVGRFEGRKWVVHAVEGDHHDE